MGSLDKVLGWLTDAKQRLSEAAPVVLNNVADIADLVSKSAKEASAWFQSLSQPPVMLEHIPNPNHEDLDLPEIKDATPLTRAFFDDKIAAFMSLRKSVAPMAATPPVLLRTMQKNKKTLMPQEIQVSLAKLIESVVDHCIEQLQSIELTPVELKPE